MPIPGTSVSYSVGGIVVGFSDSGRVAGKGARRGQYPFGNASPPVKIGPGGI